MRNKFRNILLVVLGVIIGVFASVQFSAMAQKQTAPLPLDELRQLADVFGLIKSDYVEPVEDKKLLTDAISGMVASLDPHSAYLDKKALQELKEGTQGKFGGLGIEVGTEDGYVKVTYRRHTCLPCRHQAGRSDYQTGWRICQGYDTRRGSQENARRSQYENHAHDCP